MRIVGVVIGVVLFALGVVLVVATPLWKFGLIWCLFWAGFTAYDLVKARRRRTPSAAA